MKWLYRNIIKRVLDRGLDEVTGKLDDIAEALRAHGEVGLANWVVVTNERLKGLL